MSLTGSVSRLLALALLVGSRPRAAAGPRDPSLLAGIASPESYGAPQAVQVGAGPVQKTIDAMAAARQAVRDHPDSAQAYLSLALALKAAGDIPAASQAIEQALELDSHLAEAWYEKGLIEAEQLVWLTAARYFRQAVALAPSYEAAHLGLGEMLIRSGGFEEAARELEAVLRLNPSNAGAHDGLGLIHLRQGDFAAAEAEFRQAIALRPRFPRARESLGEVLLHRRDWAGAAAAFEQALADIPDSMSATNGLATALSHLGQPDRAKAEFQKAQQLSKASLMSRRAQAENNRGVELWHAGDLTGAITALRNALAADPDYAAAHNNLGGILWQQHDQPGALAEFAAAVRSRPEFPEAQNNWGSALMFTGNVDQAMEHFQAALALRPGFASARFNLGVALEKKGKWIEAETELRRAIVLAPETAAAHIELGLLLASRAGGLPPEARSELNEGLRLDPRLKSLIPDGLLKELH